MPSNNVGFLERTLHHWYSVECISFFWHITIFVNENSQDRTGTALVNASKTMLGEIRIEQSSALFLKQSQPQPTPAINWMKVISICWGKKCIWFSIPTDVTSEALGTRLVRPGGCYLVLLILEITGRKITGWYQVSKSSSQRANHKTIIKNASCCSDSCHPKSTQCKAVVTVINVLNVRLGCGV